jgi:hypothetical protein
MATSIRLMDGDAPTTARFPVAHILVVHTQENENSYHPSYPLPLLMPTHKACIGSFTSQHQPSQHSSKPVTSTSPCHWQPTTRNTALQYVGEAAGSMHMACWSWFGSARYTCAGVTALLPYVATEGIYAACSSTSDSSISSGMLCCGRNPHEYWHTRNPARQMPGRPVVQCWNSEPLTNPQPISKQLAVPD